MFLEGLERVQVVEEDDQGDDADGADDNDDNDLGNGPSKTYLLMLSDFFHKNLEQENVSFQYFDLCKCTFISL